MLDDLVDVIETLQRRINDHGPSLRENETRTRMALIDPLLRGSRLGCVRPVSGDAGVQRKWQRQSRLRPCWNRDGTPCRH